MLGPDRSALLPVLRQGGDDADVAGTRAWTACEALHKAGTTVTPSIGRRDGDVVELLAPGWRVATMFISPSRGPRRVIAIAYGAVITYDAPVEAHAAGGSSRDGRDAALSVATPTPVQEPGLLTTRFVGKHMETRFVVAFDES